MKKIKKISIILFVTVFSLLVISCRKDDDTNDGPTNAYPRKVKITDVVTSPQSTSLQLISYNNETGGVSNVTNPTLPFSKSITRTVNQYDTASMGFGGLPDTNVKLEIFVDDKQVETQTFTNVGTGALVHLFP